MRLNDEGKTHLKNADLISEVEFLTELAHHLLDKYPIDWRKLQDTRYIRQLIAKTIPGYEKISAIDDTRAEFTISERIITTPHFKTPSGRAKLFSTPLPNLTLPAPKDFRQDAPQKSLVLALMTGRSYAQHNTVVYKIHDEYRGIPHRHCILMNRSDAEKIALSEHDRVTVQGDAGQLDNIEVIYGAIREGAALMFYPEVNVIFKANTEVRSGTPAYKRVPVLVFRP